MYILRDNGINNHLGTSDKQNDGNELKRNLSDDGTDTFSSITVTS